MAYNMSVHLALPKIKADTKKQLFEMIAAEAAESLGCPAPVLCRTLCAHEDQESSAIGNGIAIPHLKMSGLHSRFIALATLQKPLNFDAPDGQPVDLVCILLSPESDGPLHLRGLARISRLFRNEDLCRKIRGTGNAEVIMQLFANPEGWLVAA